MSIFKTTPNLSGSFHPQPKVYKEKKTPKGINPSAGKRTKAWIDGRAELKKKFAAWGITSCEIKLEGCLKDNFLGFAHTIRRVAIGTENIADPSKVVLACQQCHTTVDLEMRHKESTELLESIVKAREVNL